MRDDTSTYAATLVTLHAAHVFADHGIGQTDAQALGKARPGWEGWSADLRHVGLYHLVVGGMVAVTARTVRMPLTRSGLAAGLAVSAATHALWDRRWPVARVLHATGSPLFAEPANRPGCPYVADGPYLADQALHVGSLWLAALVAVRTSRGGGRRG